MSRTLDLAKQLIERESVTPYDAGCQPLLAEYLKPLGFNIEPMRFAEVDNLWVRFGTTSPLLVFAGHTDVVPTGPEQAWRHPPFTPTIDGDLLYGRGAADMKSSIAAMVTACERFLKNHPEPRGSIALLITSDEEGPSVNGTVKVIEALQQRGEKIDWCVVGEPSSSERLGDVIKNGRRGSLGGILTVKGIQGHVAYPHQADNPIHRLAPALADLCATQWDDGNASFPPTTFQVSNINGGTGANNVIPATVQVVFNFRFSTEVTADDLKRQVHTLLDGHKLDYEIDWQLSGQPFVTEQGELIEATKAAIHSVCGFEPALSTGGGTSDGRFIAPTGAQVVELGPINASIHKVDEHVRVADLDTLSEMYEGILERLLA